MAKRPELQKAEQTAQKIDELRQAVLLGDISAATRRKLLISISDMKDNLDALSREIDPVRMPDSFFDPTEPRLIGHFVALLRQRNGSFEGCQSLQDHAANVAFFKRSLTES